MTKEKGWTETALDVIALYCPEDSKALAELRADDQALADVRTLDAHARRLGYAWSWELTSFPDSYDVSFTDGDRNALYPAPLFEGATPDEARAKAAAWVREHAK